MLRILGMSILLQHPTKGVYISLQELWIHQVVFFGRVQRQPIARAVSTRSQVVVAIRAFKIGQ